MCKVAGVAGINDTNREAVWLLMIGLGEIISQHNNDGLGYAAFDQDNNIFGEKWLINSTAFTDVSKLFKNSTELERNYAFFGKKILRDEIKAMVLHTRMATCARGIQNAHPHLDDLTNVSAALIHNGVIWNDFDFTKKNSTCDSEVMVHEYVKHDVKSDLANLSKFTKDLSGWYTCLVLSKDKHGLPVMDIFSDSARLNSFFIPELNVRVYSTNLQDIVKACNMFGLAYEKPQTVARDHAYRINADTGDLIDATPIKAFEGTWVGGATAIRGGGSNVRHLHGSFDDDMEYWDHWMKRGSMK